jgi:Leucine-rich repeat (LRR) protein
LSALTNLSYFNCSANQLTLLPELPSSLTVLDCSDNKLTSLPANLPPSLEWLDCSYNELTMLPDLPPSLQHINLNYNPLHQTYPDLTTIPQTTNRRMTTPEIIAYVNETNSKTRTIKRTQQINTNHILLELYVKRTMHPHKIKLVVGDDNDVDDAMREYVETL